MVDGDYRIIVLVEDIVGNIVYLDFFLISVDIVILILIVLLSLDLDLGIVDDNLMNIVKFILYLKDIDLDIISV